MCNFEKKLQENFFFFFLKHGVSHKVYKKIKKNITYFRKRKTRKTGY